jgi:hypothetical protein
MKIKMNRREVAATTLVCGAAVLFTFAALNLAGQPAHSDASPLPACESEDSANCIWDAGVEGNGMGTSFVDIDGTAYYPDTIPAPAPGPDTTPETWVPGTADTVTAEDGTWVAADGTTGCNPGAECDKVNAPVTAVPVCTDAIADAKGICKGEPIAKAPMPHEGTVVLNGETWPYTDGFNTILYCEAPLKVGIDVDDKGNEWAGCM